MSTAKCNLTLFFFVYISSTSSLYMNGVMGKLGGQCTAPIMVLRPGDGDIFFSLTKGASAVSAKKLSNSAISSVIYWLLESK